jgi:DmsE family decaheme c-type cytochrome
MKIKSMWLGALVIAAFGSAAAWSAEPAAVPLTGDETCTGCHDETGLKPILSIYQTAHGVKADARTPGCQSCHGASEAHVRNTSKAEVRPATDISFAAGGPTSARAQTETCLTCHEGGQRMHWADSKHDGAGMACTSCHQVHTHNKNLLTKSSQMETCFSCHQAQRAQIHRASSHPLLDEQMTCSDCHNPHGSVGPKLMAKDSINETCYTCHADRRGPFLFDHSAVTDGCNNCHTPHGSNNPTLLVARTPQLCQQCHTADHSRDVNSAANLPNGDLTTVNGQQPLGAQSPRPQFNGRNCLACHSQVHGSNHPAGSLLSR